MNSEASREILLRHARAPSHSKGLVHKSGVGHCTNPLCGDKVEVSVLVQEGRILEISAVTAGCSLSTASASMMCDLVEGLEATRAEELRGQFNETLLMKSDEAWPEALASLSALTHLRQSPSRVPCALMGWFALKDALKNASS